MRFLPLVLFSIMLACGQILFKKAALACGDRPLFPGLVNAWMLLALVLYAGATLIWVAMLRSVPLSVAYPFAALGFAIVPLAAWLLFDEQLDVRYAIGSTLIISGILMTSR